MATDSKKWISELIAPAGVSFDGTNPWDVKVFDERLFDRVRADKTLGFGEAYMDGWWGCENMDQLFYKLIRADIEKNIKISPAVIANTIKAKLFNLQSAKKSFEIGEKHYDLGNDLFVAMLGRTMAYSCGYWKGTDNLDVAQEAKFDLICRKLGLKSGQKILDIGCGWGSFMAYATQNYGVSAVGITVSEEQADFGRNYCKGLPVEIRLQDYRSIDEKFDHIVSVGMIEHVGSKNYRTYMEVAKRCLKYDGLFLLHTIGGLKYGETTDPWINKYIFPNGVIPSLKQVADSAEGLFVVEDMHNFGVDYDKTLMAWAKNFEKEWPKLREKYDDRFYRMWRYYLYSCAGAFRARTLQLWQFVLSPQGVEGGYKSVR